MTPRTVEQPIVHFRGSSGYSRHGDTITLSADRIENDSDAGVTSGSLVLQLWACRSPYTGGSLAGWKLAEAPLGVLPAGHFLAPVSFEVPASFPESGDFAITLVIAEWDAAGFNRIHDFHTYPGRDAFLHPRLEGRVGFHLVDERRMDVSVARIHNPRDVDNLSGSLSLELWALTEPYMDGGFQGHALAGVNLGTLAGGTSWEDCIYPMHMEPPPADTYTLVLMLREWTGNGYVTRDHRNSDQPLTFPIVMDAVRQAGEPLTDVPAGPAETPAPSAEPALDTAEAGAVDDSARDSGQRASDTVGESPGQPKTEDRSVPPSLAGWKRFARRLRERIRKR